MTKFIHFRIESNEDRRQLMYLANYKKSACLIYDNMKQRLEDNRDYYIDRDILKKVLDVTEIENVRGFVPYLSGRLGREIEFMLENIENKLI